MTKFIENVNTYLSQMRIKQTYISMITGIDAKKMSRILSGTQDVTSTDMEKIAKALGQKTEFFLKDSFCEPEFDGFAPDNVVFYAGEPTQKQEEFALELMELIENADQILGARNRYLMPNGEW